MPITFDDVSRLMHLPNMGRLLNHSLTNKFEALEFMENYLVADSGAVQQELDAMRGAHARFSYIDELYKYHLIAEMDDEGDDEHVLLHRKCALRSYFLYLVSTTIFVDKSAT